MNLRTGYRGGGRTSQEEGQLAIDMARIESRACAVAQWFTLLLDTLASQAVTLEKNVISFDFTWVLW